MENIPKYLYHATFEELLDSIFQKGLKGYRWNKNYSDSKPNCVYLAIDEHVAESYAECTENERFEDSNIVVLKIDTTGLDLKLFTKDENVLDDDSTFSYFGVINKQHITVC